MQGVGMTETSPGAIFLDPADAMRKIGSTGKELLHTEARIVNEDGEEAGPNEVGELWVRGPHITPGYWNRPDATAEAFVDDWLRTGDAAKRDDEGFYYIVDRWKDMYISGGENVYPAEVENYLFRHPAVREVQVFGVPDEKFGEEVCAWIVLAQDAAASAEEIIAFCRENMARFKVPKNVIFGDLPKTSTGKVQKFVLRERAKEQ